MRSSAKRRAQIAQRKRLASSAVGKPVRRAKEVVVSLAAWLRPEVRRARQDWSKRLTPGFFQVSRGFAAARNL